jgi:hypothetical protein
MCVAPGLPEGVREVLAHKETMLATGFYRSDEGGFTMPAFVELFCFHFQRKDRRREGLLYENYKYDEYIVLTF